MPAAITTLTILGPTNLDPDAVHNSGVDGNGWVVQATMPEIVGATFDPRKMVHTFQDDGFTDGVADTKIRVVRGGKLLRRQSPNEAQLMGGVSAGVLTVFYTLEDDCFAATQIVDVQAEDGFYGGATAGPVTSPVNQSTMAYPKPLFAWLNLQHVRATGSSFAVEAVAAHRYARNGRQVDCIEFTATDAQAVPNSSPMVRAAGVSLSALQTQGPPVECFKASLSLSALTQGDLCKVNAVVKPWIGNAWDLSVEGIAWPTSQPQTLLRFKNDKAGTYGGRFAYVRASAVGGAVGSPSTPFPTIAAALTALIAANNTGGGHNDHSGSTIYLMDDGAGGSVDHFVASNPTAAAGDCWTEIRADPAAVGQVRLAFTSGLRTMPDLLNYRLPLVFSSTGVLYAGSTNNNKMIAVGDGGSIVNASSTAGSPLIYSWGLAYYRNLTTSLTHAPLSQFSNVRSMVPLALGVIDLTATTDMAISNAQALIGCSFVRAFISEISSSTVPNADLQDGRFIQNVILSDARSVSSLVEGQQEAVRGLALIQNVIERAHVAANPALALGQATNAEAVRHQNIILHHNTIPGTGGSGSNPSRVNILYSGETGGIGKPRKELWAKYNLAYDWNSKGDTFDGFSTEKGRVSNWALRFGVGMRGNVIILGGDDGNNVQGAYHWFADYWEAGSKSGPASVTFTNNQSGGTSAVGGGTYTLTGASNDAYNRVPAGFAVLSYDLRGQPRLNDGTGAAGAYERDLPPNSGQENGIEGNDSIAASGALALTGTIAKTEAGDTIAAMGSSPTGLNATVAVTEASDTGAAAAFLVNGGTFARTEASDTLTTAATVGQAPAGNGANAAIVEAPDTVQAAGVMPIGAAMAKAEEADSLAGTGSLTLGATVAIVEQSDACLSTAFSPLSGLTAGVEGPDTLAATGFLPVNANANLTEGDDTPAMRGVLPLTVQAAIGEQGDALAAAAALVNGARAAIVEEADQLTFLTESETRSAVAVTEADDALSGAGTLIITTLDLIDEAPDMLTAFGSVSPEGGFHAALALTEADDAVIAHMLSASPIRFAKLAKDKRAGLTVFRDRF